jgi:hypothetical protein
VALPTFVQPLLTAMASDPSTPPAADVGIHNREEVQNKILPDVRRLVSQEVFLQLLGREYLDLHPINPATDMVTSLNHLSKAVGKKLGGK